MDRLRVLVLTPPRESADPSLDGLEALLEPHAQAAGPGLVLDLVEVVFLNSTGLGRLVKLGMRLDQQQRRMALARPARNVERLLRMIGLHTKLPLFRTVEAARAFVEAHGLRTPG